ncbi:MAG: Rpn family recombination-promoting nuclease/putative transposase [Cytophagales bacterium]|nr:MAG: Rpn family recombination-promoting nuclease/putative transposase [Cytophagales bacterium]
MRTYISFDWAIKKILRDKANFDVLEGFLSELLQIDVKIQEILESEANKMTEVDKYDRVDILVKSDKDELMLIEIQYDSEVDYFHRMVYGMSKLISQYLQEGEPYGKLKRAYSINIVYFDLGEGKDYLYEYRGEFIGISQNDVLLPTAFQKDRFRINTVSDIFPKYYIIKAKNFKKSKIEHSFEEWVYFLQTSDIPDSFQAKGIEQAREKLRYEKMPDLDKQVYQRHIENRRIEMAVTETAKIEGRKEEKITIAKNLKSLGLPNETIAQATGLTIEEINEL